MIWQGRVHDPPPSRFAGANTEHRIDLRGWGRNAAPKVTIRARCFVASQHRDDDRAELSALRFLFFHRAAVSRRQDCFKFDSFKFGCHQSDLNSSPTSRSSTEVGLVGNVSGIIESLSRWFGFFWIFGPLYVVPTNRRQWLNVLRYGRRVVPMLR